MRFGFIHRLLTDSLAALGLIALMATGELTPAVSLLVCLGFSAALVIPERFQSKVLLTRRVAALVSIGFFVVQVVRFLLNDNLLELSLEFAAFVQVVRLATRRGAAHDQQVIVLSLLHLIAGTVLGSGVIYALCFLGFLLVAPSALVLSHLRREVEGNYRQGARDRTGLPVDVPRILRSRRVIDRSFLAFTSLLSIPIFVFTALIFVLFPRVGLKLLLIGRAQPSRMIGFSDRVDLGGVGKLRHDPTIVMRVEIKGLSENPPARLALYLRGTAFDRYKNRTWSRTVAASRSADQHGSNVALRRLPDPVRDRWLNIELEPIEPPVVFLPAEAVALQLLGGEGVQPANLPQLFVGAEDVLSYRSAEDQGLRYRVSLARPDDPPAPALTAAERERYLELPADLAPAVAELGRSWIGQEPTPLLQARAIEARLRRDYRYDLNSPSGNAKDPLTHFLFESKRGHCEFYSTALAILLRTQHIPARNVTGFIGGTYNRFGGYYAVRQGDAHSWVEAYLDGRGWVRFDPTPAVELPITGEFASALSLIRDAFEATTQRWNRDVLGYDHKHQLSLWRAVRERYAAEHLPRWLTLRVFLGGALLLVVGSGAGVYWLTRRRRNVERLSSLPPSSLPPPAALELVELYRELELAMRVRGAGRPESVPPLAHARALSALKHPIGQEVLELTEHYLRLRFGGEPLSTEARRNFARRVQALKQTPELGPQL